MSKNGQGLTGEDFSQSRYGRKDCYLQWGILAAFLILFAAISYKLAVGNIETSTILSVFLALFSIGLSVAFYFQATDVSNRFYDNTYKYTKDIAQLLTSIESGFGERLRHLDESYKDLAERQRRAAEDVAAEEEEVNTLRAEVDKLRKEKEDLLQSLLEKSQLSDEEKDRFRRELKQKERLLEKKDAELERASQKLRLLERELAHLSSRTLRGAASDLGDTVESRLRHYFMTSFDDFMDPRDVLIASPSTLQRRFKKVINQIHPAARRDMERIGWLQDNVLTPIGLDKIREIAAAVLEGKNELDEQH